MESNALLDQIDQLDGNIEALEQILAPILEDALSSTTKKLPILDRAKLNVTVVYAIESLLFSYLKINGVDAKEHPVYKELRRVQQYFGKVKEAEDIVVKPSLTLNKQAAARMIQHSLAGNGGSDMTQREKELKERILAKRRLLSSSSPASPSPILHDLSATPSIDADSMLDSISKDIQMQDREGSEEGEIEDDGPPPEPEITASPNSMHLVPQMANPKALGRKKRKHNQGQSSKLSADQKADKKARKKAKKNQTNTAGAAMSVKT